MNDPYQPVVSPRDGKKRFQKVFAGTAAFVCVAVLSLSVVRAWWQQPVALAAANITLASQQASAPTITWPSQAEAAIGAVGYGVLQKHESGKPLATASAIKLLTALSVLQEKPLSGTSDQGPAITLTQADVDTYDKYVSEDGSVVKVSAGEQISERQALEALLLPSANNIAETLANWAFGSIGAYLTYANSYAQRLGMTHTTVTDPSGFLGSTTSTPSDLTILGETAMADPVVAQIVQEPSAVIPVQGAIRNVNILLGRSGIVGIKTGNNDQDPGCFVFAANITVDGSDVTVVGAVMQAATLGDAMWASLPLITSMQSGFHKITVATAGKPIKSISAPWGSAIPLTVKKDASLVVWGDTPVNVAMRLSAVRAPATAGTTVGALEVTDSLTNVKATVPVALQDPLAKPSLFWRLEHLRW